MDVDFMYSDSLEAVRPRLEIAQRIEEAATAVDDMFNSAFQNAAPGADDSGDDSGDEAERPEEDRDDEEEDDLGSQDSPTEERAPSPDQEVVLSASNSLQESLGPSDDAEAEFARELAKMVTDISAESRKVDKKTALALWDSTVLPPNIRKKRVDEPDEDGDASEVDGRDVMSFTVITRRGNKQHARQMAVPAASALAVQTRSAQLQDKVEQQELKRLVLDYEQREEAEEMKALEARNRAGAIKIRYVG